MQTLIGLGNPGKQYEITRHNAGWLFVDSLARQFKTEFVEKKKWKAEVAEVTRAGQTALLIKPLTFMNLSGLSVQAITNFYKITAADTFVVFDDLDLEFGTFKIQFGTGPKVHNGLTSIYSELGTDQFWHVRIGIDDRQGDRTIPPDKYVLQALTSEQLKQVHDTFERVVQVMVERKLLHVLADSSGQ